MAETAAPGSGEQIAISLVRGQRELTHGCGRLALAAVDENHRRAQTRLLFAHRAGDVAMVGSRLPHQWPDGLVASRAQQVPCPPQGNRRYVVRYDAQVSGKCLALTRMTFDPIVDDASGAVAEIEKTDSLSVRV